MPRLGFNIDHVATVRNARGGTHPDPVRAAHVVVEAGADSITAHLREDRRHIRDGDIARLKAELRCPLNLEIGATPEMVAIACAVKPHAVCLVPERREERTTEGGLDVVSHLAMLRLMVSELRDAGTRVSLFIEPDVMALQAAVEIGAPVVELHTGAWCEARAAGESVVAEKEFARITKAVERGIQLGLEVHAGHGLDYEAAEIISALPGVTELNIGHFLVGDALFEGLPAVVRKMRAAMERGRARAGA